MNRINIISFFFLIIFFYTENGYSQESNITTIYMIRHAEKASDGTKDPDLTEIGRKRANLFNKMLSNVDISAIYSTPYKRTRQTVKPLADSKGLTIIEYDPRAPKLEEILGNHKGGSIVIVGHSNTIPFMANHFVAQEQFKQLDDLEYDKLFIVNTLGIGKSKVEVLSF
ncbi:phosphoglycerate mutase family protein [Fulvivirgaceae bacterium BMA10]|uniref:Phosphoglycerate mutase family protein n=1 Tax=Splendidivirga corallicola TaxID=3051826 RepID=A0ABT8KIK9_9BACT|nr:phosphoglycerate mutase family protein [Fulvivirgaceae bacterium BMA10]